MKKALMVVLSLVLVACLSIGGTVAYLSSTAKVSNNIAVGSIAITMDETKVTEDGKAVSPAERVVSNDYRIMPGSEYVKDPTVHVDDDSADCYVYVKVENPLKPIIKSNETRRGGYDTIENQMAEKVKVGGSWIPQWEATWQLVDDTDNIYRYYKTVEGGADLKVFSGFYIDELTSDLSAYKDAQITVTAYAIQAENVTEQAADVQAVAALNA